MTKSNSIGHSCFVIRHLTNHSVMMHKEEAFDVQQRSAGEDWVPALRGDDQVGGAGRGGGGELPEVWAGVSDWGVGSRGSGVGEGFRVRGSGFRKEGDRRSGSR